MLAWQIGSDLSDWGTHLFLFPFPAYASSYPHRLQQSNFYDTIAHFLLLYSF